MEWWESFPDLTRYIHEGPTDLMWPVYRKDTMAYNRPIYIQYPHDPPNHESGPMPTVEVRQVPTVVLDDLKARIENELAERKRIRMIVSETKS